ncbi:hypothetical protein DSO57_1023561 [Entomophthora muscae]|uniref:Uncharacterized protein n=1 Tax=Entomophthora muscae TaxID=34485 RepID=A0ACC2TQG1_9FUNG|nr:hypothetical protein DSO57_1023561 [Entomophthora muscae]
MLLVLAEPDGSLPASKKPNHAVTPDTKHKIFINPITDTHSYSVRNIPDINQIIIKEQCWGRKRDYLIREAKFNKDFPPSIGGNKNQIKVETELKGHQKNLTSKQAPTTPTSTLCQPPCTQPAASRPPANPLLPSQLPASPGWHQQACCQPGPGQPPASGSTASLSPAHLPARPPPATYLPTQLPVSPLPASKLPARPLPATCLPTQLPVGRCQPTCLLPGSQGPPPSQSKTTKTCSQSKKSLITRTQFQNNSCLLLKGKSKFQKMGPNSKTYSGPTEERPNQILHVSNNSSYDQWVAASQVTRLTPGSNQIMSPKTEIDSNCTLSLSHHMNSCPQEFIGLSQELPNQQQIVREQIYDLILKDQFQVSPSKPLGFPIPCFHSHLQNFAQWEII